jgi:hypothetical protein
MVTEAAGVSMLPAAAGQGHISASLHACPDLASLIKACWEHRDLRRPTAEAVHKELKSMLASWRSFEQRV